MFLTLRLYIMPPDKVEVDPCFHHLIRQVAPGIVKVNRFDLDIREKGILDEQHRASSVVSYVEPVREELVVNILNRLLQGDDVPFPCNLFLDSALFSTSRSWIPFVDAQTLLNGWAVWHAAVEETLSSRCVVPSSRCFTIFREGLSNVGHLSFHSNVRVCFHPRSQTVPNEGNVFLMT